MVVVDDWCPRCRGVLREYRTQTKEEYIKSTPLYRRIWDTFYNLWFGQPFDFMRHDVLIRNVTGSPYKVCVDCGEVVLWDWMDRTSLTPRDNEEIEFAPRFTRTQAGGK